MATIQTAYRNALKPTQRVADHEVIEVLGQGSFGITYLCRDTRNDRLVAIKEYLPGQFAQREADDNLHPLSDEHEEEFLRGLARFISEAAHLDRFVHPNIVRILDVFQANGTAYLVMNYEQGENLFNVLAQGGPLSEVSLRNILFPVLDGLEATHNEGLIHRDIKPSNIFIRTDGSPVLLDFGSARLAIERFSQTLTNIVSPGYAPIEQYATKRDKQGPWTDIYGLGATLYKAVTGVAPVEAVARAESILHDGRDPYVPAVKRASSDYSLALLGAIDRALQFRANERPQSIAEWRALLVQEDQPIIQVTGAVVSDEHPTHPAPEHAKAVAGLALATDVQPPAKQPVSRTRRKTDRPAWRPAAGLFFGANLLVAAAGAFVAPTTGLDSASIRARSHFARASADATSKALLPDLPPEASNLKPRREKDLWTFDLDSLLDQFSSASTWAGDDSGSGRLLRLPATAKQARNPAKLAGERYINPKLAGVSRNSDIPERVGSPWSDEAMPRGPVAKMLRQAALEAQGLRPGATLDHDPLQLYHRILQIDPDNQAAKSGLTTVAKRYLEFARTELDTNDVTNAVHHMRAAATVLNGTNELRSVRQALRAKRNLLALQQEQEGGGNSEFVPDLARHSPAASISRFDELRKRMAGERIPP